MVSVLQIWKRLEWDKSLRVCHLCNIKKTWQVLLRLENHCSGVSKENSNGCDEHGPSIQSDKRLWLSFTKARGQVWVLLNFNITKYEKQEWSANAAIFCGPFWVGGLWYNRDTCCKAQKLSQLKRVDPNVHVQTWWLEEFIHKSEDLNLSAETKTRGFFHTNIAHLRQQGE